MAISTVSATAKLEKLKDFLQDFKKYKKEIDVGIQSVGPASAYAEVWEWGNIRQVKKGPKTVLGTNPDGEKVWLSIQAPTGYIKINENHFWDMVKDELSKVKFSGNTQAITKELQDAGKRAMKRCIPFIADSAPVDTGKLSKSFKVIEDGDDLLDDGDRTLVIE